jgi:ATP-dependent Clp protease protease subunit
MIHELSSGFQGKFNDMKNRHQHIENLHERMIKHFSDMTGQPVKKLKKDMEKDYYMSSQQALDYGIIDGIQDKRG